jgi:uncharacterized protein (DUF697 family)/uncharacterized tellurite resistance protein B-like protein
MTDQERRAVMTLVLMAAFADDRNETSERQEVKRIADSLTTGDEFNVAALYQDVVLKKVSIDQATAALTAPETKRLAYELSVGVCDADGAMSPAERTFLAALESRLGLQAAGVSSPQAFTAKAEALAAAPLAVAVPDIPDAPAERPGTMPPEEQDRVIVNYAILNGALELLPDTMASMAIIPLQMKMVYRIGKSYGYELDSGHIKDFLMTAGIGMASQYVEQIGVRLVGGLFGRGLIGGLLGAAAKQAVSSGFSFATTYALGKLAVRYYAGGRVLSAQVLKDTYQALFGEAKALQGNYAGAIREKARTVNVAQILQDVRA